MYLEATFNGITTDTKTIEVHIEKNTSIDFRVKDIPGFLFSKKKDFYWNIFHNGKQVDVNDYTGGNTAELRVFKEHAGTKDKPSNLRVDVYEDVNSRKYIVHKLIKLSADPKIVDTLWETTQCRNLQLVPIQIGQEGLYDKDVTVKIYDQANTATPMSPELPIQLKAGTNMVEWMAKNNTKEQKKYYYTISYKDSSGQEVVLFDGKQEGMLLSVAAMKYNDHKYIYPSNLTPVTVIKEEYFTQKYEPCKYTAIKVTVGTEAPVMVFDEEETASNFSNDLKKPILCGNDSKTIKIELVDLATDQCRLVLEKKEETHQTGVFDVVGLKAFNVEYTPKEQIKEQLEISLAYPYQHLDNLWEFLLQYNHITLPLRTIPVEVPIKTCRYSKTLNFNLLPDISWAFHFQWGNPREHLSKEAKSLFKKQYGEELLNNLQGNKVFYEENQVSLYDKGLVKEIDTITNWIEEQNVVVKKVIGLLLGEGVARNIIFEYLKGASLDFKVGLHALYNYDSEGKNPTHISYTDEHPWIAKAMVGGAVAVGLVVDGLLLYLTRGKNLPGLLRKAQKVYKYTRSAAGYLGANTYINQDEGLKIITPQLAYANGIGLKKQDDGSISLIHEYTLTAAPLFAISDIKKWDIGKYILQLKGISGFFDKFHQYVGYAQLGQTIANPIKGKLKPVQQDKGKTTISIGSLRDIREVVYDVENKMENRINAFVKKYFGAEAEMIIAFEGFYDAHIQLKSNMSTQTFDLFDGISHYLGKSEVTFGKKQGIDGYIEIKGKVVKKIGFSRFNNYIPDFLQDWTEQQFADVEVKGELKASIRGSLYFERTFTYNAVTASVAALEAVIDNASGVLNYKEKQSITKSLVKNGTIQMPHYRDNYIFTGLIGELILKVEIQVDKDKDFGIDVSEGEDEKGNTKPIVMEFIPGFVIPGELVPIFEEPKKE